MLEKPVAIELSPYLAKISEVVSNDVTEIMCNSIKETCFNNYQEIQKDIVNKISVWIATILEESSFKIISEDLQDIEEEEGHILDFIDQVIDSVMIKCDGTNDKISVEHETSSEQLSIYDEAQELSERITEFNTDYEYFQRVFLNLIDNVISEKLARFDISPEYLKKYGSIENIFYSKDLANSVDIDSLKEYINDILIDIIKTAIKMYLNNLCLTKDEIEDETIQEHEDTKNIKELYNNNKNIDDTEDNDNDQNRLNEELSESQNEILNETEPTITSTDTPDDSDKKVKFSDFTIDKSKGLLKFSSSQTKIRSDPRVFKSKNILNAEITKTIYLTSPNPYLLSNADESWPEEVSLSLTKSLASINKSVISLGQIRELEEDLLSEHSFVDYDNLYSNELSFEVINNYYPDYSEKNCKKINEVIEEAFESLAINNGNHNHLSTNKKNIINEDVVELGETVKIKINNNDNISSPKNTAQFSTHYNENIENKNDGGGEGQEVKLHALHKEILSTQSVPIELEGKTDNFAVQGIKLDESFQIKLNDYLKTLTEETGQFKTYDEELEHKNESGEKKGERYKVKYDNLSSQITTNELHNKYKINEVEKKGEKLAASELVDKPNDEVIENIKINSPIEPQTSNSKDLAFIKNTKMYAMSIQHLPRISIIDNIYNENAIKVTQQRIHTYHKTTEIINKYLCVSNEKLYEWCYGLSNVVYNLDIWLNWIHNVTSQIELLHNKRFRNERDWLILKHNIDYDTQSWLLLSQKQINGLKRCRNCYLKVMPKACICKKLFNNKT